MSLELLNCPEILCDYIIYIYIYIYDRILNESCTKPQQLPDVWPIAFRGLHPWWGVRDRLSERSSKMFQSKQDKNWQYLFIWILYIFHNVSLQPPGTRADTAFFALLNNIWQSDSSISFVWTKLASTWTQDNALRNPKMSRSPRANHC